MAEQRKQPRKILTEEDYTSTLTHIVTRDYFPSLHSLRRDAAILEARSRGDVATAVAIRREARREEIQREQELLEDQAEEMDVYEGEMTIATTNNMQQVTGTRKRPRPLKHESITGFHARVTSEDNAEFESNQEVEKKQREMNLGIIYSSAADKTGRLAIEAAVNGKTVTDRTNQRTLLGCETPLGLASDLFNTSPSAGLRITGSESKKSSGIGRNGLFFQPQHVSEKEPSQKGQLLLESSTATNNPTGNFLALTNNDTDQQTSDGLLMPPPPARRSDFLCVIASEDTNAKSKYNNLPLPAYQLVEYQPKPLVPHINPPATRFPNQSESRLLATSSASATRSKPSLHGDTSDATTDLDEIPRSLDEERAARHEAAIREHETFVPMTPLIQPGRDAGVAVDAIDEAPIMTWGKVASTPLVLGNGAAIDKSSISAGDWEPTQPLLSSECDFDILEENNREKLAHRAEKKLNHRAKIYKSAGVKAVFDRASADKDFDDDSIKSGASSVKSKGTVRSSFDRSASLTPAGRALLKANTTCLRSGQKFQKVSSKSRIFQASSASSKTPSAASRDSFGSALRSAYSQSSTPSRITKTSLSRRAAEGSTPKIFR